MIIILQQISLLKAFSKSVILHNVSQTLLKYDNLGDVPRVTPNWLVPVETKPNGTERNKYV